MCQKIYLCPIIMFAHLASAEITKNCGTLVQKKKALLRYKLSSQHVRNVIQINLGKNYYRGNKLWMLPIIPPLFHTE